MRKWRNMQKQKVVLHVETVLNSVETAPEPGLLGKAVLPQLLDIPQALRTRYIESESVGIRWNMME